MRTGLLHLSAVALADVSPLDLIHLLDVFDSLFSLLHLHTNHYYSTQVSLISGFTIEKLQLPEIHTFTLKRDVSKLASCGLTWFLLYMLLNQNEFEI